MEIILSTGNAGKVAEINEVFAGTPIKVIPLTDAGIEGQAVEGVDSLEENSYLKAHYAWSRAPGRWAMADDTGLFIDALNGEPGVVTADWAGEAVKGNALMEYAISRIKEIPEDKRTAYFETVATVISPTGETTIFKGRVSGRLIVEPRGTRVPALPFIPIFIPEGSDKTFGEMPIEDINATSHRGKAFTQVREFLLSKIQI